MSLVVCRQPISVARPTCLRWRHSDVSELSSCGNCLVRVSCLRNLLLVNSNAQIVTILLMDYSVKLLKCSKSIVNRCLKPCFCCCRAAQKFSISSKKRKKKESSEGDAPLPQPAPMFPTNFRSVLQHSPPPVPPCLTRNITRPQPALPASKVSPTMFETNITILTADSYSKS